MLLWIALMRGLKNNFLLLCLSLLLITGTALAANTPPPCVPGALITNGGNGQYGCNLVGDGLAVVTSGSALYLTVTSTVPDTAIIEENGPPIIEENGPYIVEE